MARRRDGEFGRERGKVCKRTSWRLAFSAFFSAEPQWYWVSSTYLNTYSATWSEAVLYWMVLMALYLQLGLAPVWKSPFFWVYSWFLRKRVGRFLDRWWEGLPLLLFSFFKGMFDLHNSVDSTLVFPTNCTTKIKKCLYATLFSIIVQAPSGPVPAVFWHNV